MQIGRNDPCLCGSGVKYKKCCLRQHLSPEVMDFNWRKLRQVEGEVIDDHLLPYLQKTFPKGTIDIAWTELILGEDLPEDASETIFSGLFTPWLLFNWIPFGDDEEDNDDELTLFQQKKPIALQYLDQHPNRLTSYQQKFIKAICQTHYSFYVVLEVIFEKSLLLKDILLGTEYRVKEKNATHIVTTGNIMFTRVLTLEDQSICVGVSPYVIDGRYYTDLLDFREELIEDKGSPLTTDDLRDTFDWLVRDEWLFLLEKTFNPSLPIMHNTDGDLIELCTLHFSITLSPEEAFRKLLPLTLNKKPEPDLEDITRDKKGHITKIQFSWLKRGNKIHKSWRNTTMGDITLQKNKLIVQVNSRARAKKIQTLLEKYLGEAIEYKKTVHESQIQQIKRVLSMPSVKENALKALNALPEIIDLKKQTLDQHWRDWLDFPIPALQDQTPREASKTEKGRERLEALFLYYQQQDNKISETLLKTPIVKLREDLGLEIKRIE